MKLKYGVKGMMCTACAAHVERAARSVCDGEITVSLLTNSIILNLPDTEKEEAVRTEKDNGESERKINSCLAEKFRRKTSIEFASK